MVYNLSKEQVDDFYKEKLVLLLERQSYIMYWKYDIDHKQIYFYHLDVGETVAKGRDVGYSNDPNIIYSDQSRYDRMKVVRSEDVAGYTKLSQRYIL